MLPVEIPLIRIPLNLKENHHIELPLEALIARLEAAGFRMDTARKLRLLRVLEQEGPEVIGDFEGMKYRLAPFVARSPQEQERFYAFFDQFWEECKAEAEQLNQFAEAPLPDILTPEPARKFSKWWIIPLLLLPVFGIIWYLLRPGPPILEPCEVAMDESMHKPLREGDTLVCLNRSTCIDSSAYVWEVRDAASRRTEFTDTAFHSNWLASGPGEEKLVILRHTAPVENKSRIADTLRLTVQCANPPKIGVWKTPEGIIDVGKPYKFSAKIEAGVQAEWVFDEKDTLRGTQVEYAFSSEGEASVGLLVFLPEQKSYCYSYEEKKLSIGGKPLLGSFAARYDTPGQVQQFNGWYWLFSFLPFFFALWLLTRWWKKRHEKTPEKTVADLEAEYPIHDAGPYFVPYLPQGGKITVPRDFFRMAEVMRRRELGVRHFFDAAASVRATVDAGGYPEWREKSDTRPAEYLFLVQRSDERNQQGRLFERLTDFLKRREAPAEVYFHSGRFDVFRNPEHPEGLGLAELKQHYPGHRLVLLGDGHGLVNPYSPEIPSLMAAPVKSLRAWPRRMLLTPEPVSAWSFQETLLHRNFLLYPADTDGLLAGLEMLDRMEEYEPGNYSRWESELLRLHPAVSHRYRQWETPEDHKNYLQNPEWYRWLCALAVCTQPDWALTIAIGRAIGVEVTHDALLTLSRIPWLSNNAPDANLRMALLQQLNPEDEALARKAIADELEHVRSSVDGSFAQTDWTTNLAVQRFALDPHNESHKETLRNLKRLGLLSGPQLAELDLIVRKKMDKKGVSAQASKGIATWLEAPKPKPWWTPELAGGLAGIILSVVLLLYGFNYNRTATPDPIENAKASTAFWMNTRQLDDQAIELNNKAVAIWIDWEAKMDSLKAPQTDAIAITRDTGAYADQLLSDALKLRLTEKYALADSNRTILAYNFAKTQLNLQLEAMPLNAGAGDLAAIRKAFEPLTLPNQLNAYNATAFTEQSAIRLAALHGQGLCDFYLGRRDSAMITYDQLQALTNDLYFDTVSMPVNLKTLLAIPLPDTKKVTLKSKLDIKSKEPKTIPKKTSSKIVRTDINIKPLYADTVRYLRAIKNADLKCPEGSFYDPVDGGTCWTCPPGYERTTDRITGSGACSKAGRTEYAKATVAGKGIPSKGGVVDCEPGQFSDAGSGLCYTCPRGYSRNALVDVNDEKACEKAELTAYTKATKITDPKCPEGSFRDGNSCWSCPPNYVRTIYALDGDKACELKVAKKN